MPPIIDGDSKYIAQFVGGVTEEEKLDPKHDLMLGIREIRNENYLIARTTIFGNGRFPTYEAIVGKVLDPQLILKKFT